MENVLPSGAVPRNLSEPAARSSPQILTNRFDEMEMCMTYLVPFLVLKDAVRLASVKGQLKLDITYDEFLDIIKRLLQAVPVDEAWYRETYPDVGDAIKDGTYRSCRHHFTENGYFEGRRPGPFAVDETFYLKAYPDVARGIQTGEIASASEHFASHGYQEGRMPCEA